MTDKMLELCRAVKYTPNPNGRKGSRKCGECGFFFVPDDVVYSFDHPAWFVDTEHHTGREWYEATGCCPNCWPKGPELPFGGRRCLGARHSSGCWLATNSCGEWFSILAKSRLWKESAKKYRTQRCPGCCRDSGHTSKIDWERVREYARAWAAELGRAPTVLEWHEEGRQDTPSLTAIRGRFDKYNNFVAWCGLRPRKTGQNTSPPKGNFHQRYRDKEILALMQSVGKQTGRALSTREWNAKKLKPCSGTIILRFGSWSNAWRLAGFEPLLSFTCGYNDTPMGKIQCEAAHKKAFLAMGLDPAEIGRKGYELCNDPNSNYNRLRRETEEKTERYLAEMLEAHERFENGKFRASEGDSSDD